MKRKSIVVAVIALAFLLSACGGSKNTIARDVDAGARAVGQAISGQR